MFLRKRSTSPYKPNLNVRAYILVVVFAVVLALVVAYGIYAGWGAFRKPVKEALLNPDAANAEALMPGRVDLAAVDLFMSIIPPSASEETRLLTLQLDGLNFYARDDSDDLDVVEVCLDALDMHINPDDEDNNVYQRLLEEPVCVTPLPDEFVEEETSIGDVAIDHFYDIAWNLDTPSRLELKQPDIISLNFWYPFDGFTLRSDMFVDYALTRSDGSVVAGTIIPYIAWDIQTSGTRAWDIQLETETLPYPAADSTDLAGYYESLTMHFQRSWLYRLVFPFFIAGMVLLIGLMPLLGEMDTLVDISAAMLFGIFGLKGIIGPGEQMGQTILDIALIGLYIVLAFAVLVFFVNRIIQRHKPALESDESN